MGQMLRTGQQGGREGEMTMAEETLRGDRDVRHLNTGDGLTDMQVTNTTNYEKNFGALFMASNWGRLFKVRFQKL